jgi:transposase-like protein
VREPASPGAFASWKDREALAAPLKRSYTAASAEAAAAQLDTFERSARDAKFPTVAAAWRRAWDRAIPFFAFPPEVQRGIYATDAIESIHARLRKKTRGHFPSDDAASKLIRPTCLTTSVAFYLMHMS